MCTKGSVPLCTFVCINKSMSTCKLVPGVPGFARAKVATIIYNF